MIAVLVVIKERFCNAFDPYFSSILRLPWLCLSPAKEA